MARHRDRLERPPSVRTAIPDYSRQRPCEATPDELARFGVADVPSLVRLFNREFVSRGGFPITQGDYPSTRGRLKRLIARWEAG